MLLFFSPGYVGLKSNLLPGRGFIELLDISANYNLLHSTSTVVDVLKFCLFIHVRIFKEVSHLLFDFLLSGRISLE